MPKDARSLEELLTQIEAAGGDAPSVSLDDILEEVGRRSFGPMLLVAGLVVLMPLIGDIPGMPTATGAFVALTVGQILFGRSEVWLPRWMLDRSVRRTRLAKGMRRLRRPAKAVDRLLRPRLVTLTRAPWSQVLAGICLLVALVMPVMEVVPFSANIAGIILAASGLSLIARDGLMALVALVVTVLGLGLAAYALL